MSKSSKYFGRRGDPSPSKIICMSLAIIMQRMVSDVNPKNQNFDYLLNSLTEVPVYMKDRYKNGLCYISKIMRMLISKCDFIKDIIQKTKINLSRNCQFLLNSDQLGGLITEIPNIDNFRYIINRNDIFQNNDFNSIEKLTNKLPSDEVKEKLSEIISSISEYTFSLVSIAENVQRDLSSDVTYFETYNNFIANYKNRYDKNPLMPLSHSLFVIKNLDLNTSWATIGEQLCYYHQDTLFMPDKLIGTTEFKLQYGMRQIILNNKVNIINYPGIIEQIKKYNETSITSNVIEIDQYERFAQKIISIVRYNIDCRNFKSYVQSDTCSNSLLPETGSSTYCNLNSRDSNFSPNPENQVYSYITDRKLTNIIFSIESSNQDDEINKIISSFNQTSNKDDITRMTECVNNLVDLNILPINMNVLMKDIPLINLYNYDYTFELMAAKLYNKDPKKFRDSNTVINNIYDTQDAFLTLLYHPYIDLENNNQGQKMWLGSANNISEYNEYISRIMRGDNSLGLSRPKFLSDQLFNKVLFRSVYPSASTYDEGGVNSSVGIWKGQYGYDGTIENNNVITDRTWLTYPFIDDKGNFTIRHREFTPNILSIMENIGRMRFDTSIVRNLFFIVNVLRLTRLKLNRELTSSRNIIVNSHYAVNPTVTEYGMDPFGTNEIYNSKAMDGQNRFNVMDTM
jgi:hypothetical protein